MRIRAYLTLLFVLSSAACSDHAFESWLRGRGGRHAGGGHDAPPLADGGADTEDCGVTETCTDAQFRTADGRCVRKTSAVSAGVDYTCAVLDGAQIKCWGGDTWMRLGYGTPSRVRGDQPGELGSALPFVNLGPGLSARSVVASNDLTCALLTDGTVKCWGYGGYGAPGTALISGLPPSLVPARAFGTRDAVAVTAGAGFGSALLDDGSITSWGDSGGQLGAERVVVQFDRSPIYDDWHVCGVLADGSVVCDGRRGAQSSGALGYAPTFPTTGDPPPVDLGTGLRARAVATGRTFTCALLDDASVKCWGLNDQGQLGQGDTIARGLDPSLMGDALAPVPLGKPAVGITAGLAHACALLADGSVKCWGQNDAGQLGIGSMGAVGDAPGEVSALAPVDLGPGRSAVAIDAGSHTCAVLDNGGLKCWGPNGFGQLGQGDTFARGSMPGQLGAALPEIDVGT